MSVSRRFSLSTLVDDLSTQAVAALGPALMCTRRQRGVHDNLRVFHEEVLETSTCM